MSKAKFASLYRRLENLQGGVVANKIISLNKRQTFPIVFDEVYFLARKGQQSYSQTVWLQSVTVKGGHPFSFIVLTPRMLSF